MKRLVLISDKLSKRYEYFIKASNYYNINVEFMTYEKITLKNGDFVKIDPMKITSNRVDELNDVIEEYTQNLNAISNYDVTFLNHPKDILLLLDKYKTKQILEQANIKTTPMINNQFTTQEELFSYLKLEKITRIFIKPRYGSGASGIVALKYNPKLNEAVIYTTIYEKDGVFYNGGKTNYFKDKTQVNTILNFILSLPIVIEKWISKKKYNKINYDLRVVMFKQELLYIVARGSKSPITNLHLNNMPLDENIITNKDEIKLFCQEVMSTFPELNYAGIDVLISPKNELYVIEINAQGDAIYNDFYNENSIYKRQIQAFLEG